VGNHAAHGPEAELLVHRPPIALSLMQVAPSCAGEGDLQDGLDGDPVIRGIWSPDGGSLVPSLQHSL